MIADSRMYLEQFVPVFCPVCDHKAYITAAYEDGVLSGRVMAQVRCQDNWHWIGMPADETEPWFE